MSKLGHVEHQRTREVLGAVEWRRTLGLPHCDASGVEWFYVIRTKPLGFQVFALLLYSSIPHSIPSKCRTENPTDAFSKGAGGRIRSAVC